MIELIIAADPLLLKFYRKGGDVPRPRFIQVFEEGKAPWSKLLCKVGLHRWRPSLEHLSELETGFIGLPPRYTGFNLDRCLRQCGVRRLWVIHDTRGGRS